MSRYLIQRDNRSQLYPYRVVSTSGTCLAYFVTQGEAVRYCEAN
jgi:hypothetical protein